MSSLSVPAFAKINWILKVLGRRGDGFHEVVTVLQTIDLKDHLDFTPRANRGVDLSCTGRPVSTEEDNLVFRAAQAFLEQSGIASGVRIQLHKHIPIGAGLGGGSSNAAITLLAMNDLFDFPLSPSTVLKLAKELGSDVPFFLQGGAALARGRGEQLEPLPDPQPENLLLFYPGLEVSTARAYALGKWPALENALELTTNQVNTTILRFRGRVSAGVSVVDLLENDFEDPILREYPILAKAADSLREAGCRYVALCGSGSTILGWAEPGHLERVAEKVRSIGPGEVFLSRTLSTSLYRNLLGDSGVSTLTTQIEGQ